MIAGRGCYPVGGGLRPGAVRRLCTCKFRCISASQDGYTRHYSIAMAGMILGNVSAASLDHERENKIL